MAGFESPPGVRRQRTFQVTENLLLGSEQSGMYLHEEPATVSDPRLCTSSRLPAPLPGVQQSGPKRVKVPAIPTNLVASLSQGKATFG